ncbi:carotenoid biosynthesis protein [Rubellicoccus peritrichatus]|uniref:Carotenoid biosynthesis protein n=1 Tax=Rubellicoccus peritrichatus TaxID=3080537 RepID=A0AAQ3LGS4_9BACT|nr:carotenoid biosynthesis protein [Puniceicoccus sp. CR14]WOO41869.1 carotenoid biosynthesis protein [Puniceicoccus sp. CR14]
MRTQRYRRSRLLVAYRIFGAWYAIWFCVGLIFVGFNRPSLFGPIEDFLFMFLAGTVLLIDVARRIGWLRALVTFAWVAGMSGIIEAIGAMTGFPFGSYAYTENFGPRLFGVLPLAIPFAWWAVLMPLHIGLLRFVEHNWISARTLPFIVGLFATLIDAALEPVATIERSYWIWSGGGLWYGVPWVNFLGWFGTATLLSFGVQFASGVFLSRAYRWENLHTVVIPLAVLFTIIATFLLANIVASFWFAAVLSALLLIGVIAALRRMGGFRWRTLAG